MKNIDTHETPAGIVKSHFMQARGPLFWGPGTHFESFCLPFWCLFQARAKKWKMQRRLSENPPFSDLEGHFFEPFPASIRKRSHNIPSLPFLWDFSIFLVLPGDVPEPTQKQNKKRGKMENAVYWDGLFCNEKNNDFWKPFKKTSKTKGKKNGKLCLPKRFILPAGREQSWEGSEPWPTPTRPVRRAARSGFFEL